MLAEPADPAVLVEVRPGGGAAPRSGPAGASGLSPTALGLRRPRCLAPQHRPSAFPFLQVCKKICKRWNCRENKCFGTNTERNVRGLRCNYLMVNNRYFVLPPVSS